MTDDQIKEAKNQGYVDRIKVILAEAMAEDIIIQVSPVDVQPEKPLAGRHYVYIIDALKKEDITEKSKFDHEMYKMTQKGVIYRDALTQHVKMLIDVAKVSETHVSVFLISDWLKSDGVTAMATFNFGDDITYGMDHVKARKCFNNILDSVVLTVFEKASMAKVHIQSDPPVGDTTDWIAISVGRGPGQEKPKFGLSLAVDNTKK